MSFLYYLPQYQGTPTAEHMRKIGLGYAFDEPGVHSCKNKIGPDGSGGMVVATQSVPQEDCKWEASQVWRTIPLMSHPVWVGMWTDQRKPTPKTLERAEQVLSFPIELEDGNTWNLPVACRWEIEGEECMQRIVLPRARRYSDEGKWEPGQVVERCRRLWFHVAVPYMDAFASAVQQAIDKTGEPPESVAFDYDIDQLLVDCLQQNYRVGPCEVSMLEAFTSQSAQLAGNALINASWYLELQKKMRDARQGSLSLSHGATQATAGE